MARSDGEFYLNLQSSLNERFVSTLHNAVSSAHSLSEMKLQYELNVLLGIGYIVNKNINLLSYTATASSDNGSLANSSVVRQLIDLSSPDLNAIKTIALQSRLYYSSLQNTPNTPINSVSGGYYRLPWTSSNDDRTRGMIRRLCALVGRQGQRIIEVVKTQI
jgi:hypothetical protein